MKNQKLIKLLLLVFTLTILATLALNTAALTNKESYNILANIPDSEVDEEHATDKRDESHKDDDHTGVVDDALDKASEELDDAKNDVENAMTDAKDDMKDAVDEAKDGGIAGIFIAILIAVAIIIIIIVMVSKNNGKYNRK